jgi:catechol 2,3-dioxygenase-like lactoylglutathione lyase family enzyme
MELDHVIIGVADLDAATRTYEIILGLPASVRSDHPTYGTRNALFLFERGPYLELLSPRPDTQGSFSTPLRGFLAERGEGLYGLALAPDDIDAAVARLRTLGIAVADAARGTGVSADGRVREWRNTRLPAAAWHNSFSLLIEHSGWDWRQELRVPPVPERAASAVTGIHHAVFSVADADDASADWTERFGLHIGDRIESEQLGARVLIHPAGAATIEAVSAARPDSPLAERIARQGEGLSGLAFQVSGLDAAVEALRAAGLTLTDAAPGVLPNSRVARIDPASAHGVAAQLIEFA